MQDFVLDEAAYPSRPPVLSAVEAESSGEHWSEKFRNMEKYDWNDRKWLRKNKGKFAFLPIPLSQDFFMIVSPDDYERMTTYPDGSPKKWYARVKRDENGKIISAYAGRSGRKDKGEPEVVLAHREILDCLKSDDVVDHVNGWGLDNRRSEDPLCNLILCPQSMNTHNGRTSRRVNFHIKYRNVEEVGKDEVGRQLYGWIRSHRIGMHWVKDRKTGDKVWRQWVIYHRSKPDSWLTQEEAHEAYLKELERITEGRRRWAHVPTSVHFPKFPELLDSEPKRRKSRQQKEKQKLLESIPF